MSKDLEPRQLKIPKSTRIAAQILDCNPETLQGLYSSEYFYEEVENNEEFTSQMRQIYSALRNLFEPENEPIRGKIMQAIKTDRLFEIFVFEFFIQECANKLASGITDLSEETFKEALKLIRENKHMQKKLEEETTKIKVSDLSDSVFERNRLKNASNPDKQITKLEMLIKQVCEERFSTRQKVFELIECTKIIEDSNKPKTN
ncbi:hypothetical protein C0416_03865 [bacterium]|nr:hypothetical protein [bacterium]